MLKNNPIADCGLRSLDWRRAALLLVAGCGLLFSVACRRDMQDQPKYKPYRAAPFFNDKLSTRPPVEGTIARGQLQADAHLYTGKQEGGPAPGPGNEFAGFETTFPFPVTEEALNRGQNRYEIFCSTCHGPLGDGNGMIARRGFEGIKTYHDDRLRNAPVGYIFDVVTNGFGKMSAYNHQIPVKDRWAIVAYVKALQKTRPDAVPGSAPNAPPAQPAASPASPAATPQNTANTPAAGGHN
jgi:mono/diheme cytochrome c family protein